MYSTISNVHTSNWCEVEIPFRKCGLLFYLPVNGSCSRESSPEIQQILDASRSCPSCGGSHGLDYQYNLTYKECLSKVCSKGCLHNGHPLQHAACEHDEEAPYFTISKLGNNKSIPLVKSMNSGSSSIGTQISLISKSALQSLHVHKGKILQIEINQI